MRGDAFYTLRPLLCDNKVVLKHRLRLFSSCVVFSMYWCAGSCLLKILTPQTVLNAMRQVAHCWKFSDSEHRIHAHFLVRWSTVPDRPCVSRKNITVFRLLAVRHLVQTIERRSLPSTLPCAEFFARSHTFGRSWRSKSCLLQSTICARTASAQLRRCPSVIREVVPPITSN